MTILEIKQWRNGEVVWEQRDVKNVLHIQGEEFILRAAFVGGNVSTVIPPAYFLGMDNREVVSASDTMDDIFLEPSTFGYSRQVIASSGDFTVVEESGHFVAVGPLIAFEATDGTWGPVQNVFLTDTEDNDGFLISTAKLGTVISVSEGDAVTLRISLALRDCPPPTEE
jgi:hypothetical protein